MKKAIITCALIISASVVSYGQTTEQTVNQPANAAPTKNAAAPMALRNPETMAERRARMYEKQLNLTPEQYKGVYDAELNFVKQQQAMRTSGAQPAPGQYQQMMATKDEQFKKVMTADQYAKYDASRPKPGVPANAGTPANAAPSAK